MESAGARSLGGITHRCEASPLKDVFVHFPRGEKHGATNWTEEGIVLLYWDSPPRPEIVE